DRRRLIGARPAPVAADAAPCIFCLEIAYSFGYQWARLETRTHRGLWCAPGACTRATGGAVPRFTRQLAPQHDWGRGLLLTIVLAAAARAGAAPPPVSLGERSTYAVDDATGIAIGDFDGDGHPDIAAIAVDPADGAPTVALLLSRTNGTFRVQS